MATPRGKAKQRLFATSHSVAAAYRKTATEIEQILARLELKDISEREAIEQIHDFAIATLHEAPLTELWSRLSEFEVHNHLEKREHQT